MAALISEATMTHSPKANTRCVGKRSRARPTRGMVTTITTADIGKIRAAVASLSPWVVRIDTWKKCREVTSIDKPNNPAERIQKAGVASASRRVRPCAADATAPASVVMGGSPSGARSRFSGLLCTKNNTAGSNNTQVLAPNQTQAWRQPTASINHCDSGGCTAMDAEKPMAIILRAKPRRRSNQWAMRLEHPNIMLPWPRNRRAANATASHKIPATAPKAIQARPSNSVTDSNSWRGPIRSKSFPMRGRPNAATRVAKA